jgi:hypothetical protein
MCGKAREPSPTGASGSNIIFNLDRAQDRPESKQILAKLAGKNQHLRKANISEVGSLCSAKFMGCSIYRTKTHRWTEWPRGQSEYNK